MNPLKIFTAIALSLLLIGCNGPSARERAEANANRAKILNLISVGNSFAQAEAKLEESGFKFYYDKPIDPTGRGEHLQQLVLVHPAFLKSDTQSSFRYTVGADASKSESLPFIVVEANSAGIITKLK